MTFTEFTEKWVNPKSGMVMARIHHKWRQVYSCIPRSSIKIKTQIIRGNILYYNVKRKVTLLSSVKLIFIERDWPYLVNNDVWGYFPKRWMYSSMSRDPLWTHVSLIRSLGLGVQNTKSPFPWITLYYNKKHIQS